MKRSPVLEPTSYPKHHQRGNIYLGLVLGLVIGLGIALGVAYMIQKNPPVEKPNVRAPDVPVVPKIKADGSISEELQDPNSPLKPKPRAPDTTSGVDDPPPAFPSSPPPPPSTTETAKPNAIYWIQVGAYTDRSAAESQKATLALQGMQSKITEHKGETNVTYRVRLGPFNSLQEVEDVKNQLNNADIPNTVIKFNKS